MKIVHISTSDQSGGAAIAAYRLNEAMCIHHIDSKMLVYNKKSNDKNVFPIIRCLKKKRYFFHFFLSLIFKRLVLKAPFAFSFGIGGVSHISKNNLLLDADIIYIHFINCGFLSLNEIKEILLLGKPVIFFMHDMWILTGGCHHSFECIKYTSSCHDCSNINRKLLKNIVSYNFEKKRDIICSFNNVYGITPSFWLTNCAKNSILFQKKIVNCIPNLIDTSVFKIIDKKKARDYFHFPMNKKLILFGADGGNKNKYKGWMYLNNALQKLKIRDIEVVVFGNELDDHAKKFLPFTAHSIGHISDINLLVMLYNAVDVFVTPSLAEAFGQTIFEAQACGTLVVGFDVGGIPDLIKHLKTGYLAKYMDSIDLASGIEWALQYKNDQELLEGMRKYVIDNFSYKVVVQKHLDMIHNIVDKH